MIRFLHAADFHLDSPFSFLPTALGEARRAEGRKLVMDLADYVNDNQISLVLLAGDLFDNPQPQEDTVSAVKTALGAMNAQVVIAPGNHDCASATSPYRTGTWPENVHIFTTSAMETLDFPQWNLTVSGAAFTAPEQATSMLPTAPMPQDGKVHLGLFHGEIQPPEPRYHPITKEEILQSAFHYLALGHTHKRCLPATVGSTLVAWPGCLEGRGFDETGEKGFYAGIIADGGSVSVAFVPFAKRLHLRLSVDVTGKDPLAAVLSQLSHDAKDNLYRIALTGGRTEAEPVDTAALTAALEPLTYYVELRDETAVVEDIWAREGEDSLRGMFLREMRAALDSATDDLQRQTVEQALGYGLAALDGKAWNGVSN